MNATVRDSSAGNKKQNAFFQFKKLQISQKFVKNLKKQRRQTLKLIKGSINGLPDSEHHIRRMVNSAMAEIGIAGNHSLIGRKEIMKIAHHMNLKLTMLQATEIILSARGTQMEESKACNFEEIIKWFHSHVSILRPTNGHTFTDFPSGRSIDCNGTADMQSITINNSPRRKHVMARSQPRIHKRIDQFRRMRLRELRQDKDFMADVDE